MWDRPCDVSVSSSPTGKTSSCGCDCKTCDVRLLVTVSSVFQKRNVYWACRDATAYATEILEEYNICLYTVRYKAATSFKVSTEADWLFMVLRRATPQAGRCIGTFRNNSYVNNSWHNEVCMYFTAATCFDLNRSSTGKIFVCRAWKVYINCFSEFRSQFYVFTICVTNILYCQLMSIDTQ